MIRLFTVLYPEPHAGRARELCTCLKRNVGNAAIGSIEVLQEGGANAGRGAGRVRYMQVRGRPAYSDFFARVNDTVSNQDVSIIANTDIYFDETLRVLEQYPFGRECLALTRWDIGKDGRASLFASYSSQDAWVFRGPVRGVVADFPVGIPGCDGRIAYELHKAGYRVRNPCLSIKAYHLHLSGYRTHRQQSVRQVVPPPYRRVPHSNLFSYPVTQWNRLFRGRLYLPYRRNTMAWPMLRDDLRRVPGRAKESLLTSGGDGAKAWGRRGAGALFRRIFEPWLPVRADVPALLEQYLAGLERVTVVHVGAHDGIRDDPLGNRLLEPRFRGVLVEPDPAAFSALEKTMSPNPNLEFEQCAVSAQEGTAELVSFPYGTAYAPYSSLCGRTLIHYETEQFPDLRREEHRLTCRTRRLDSILDEHGIEDIDLLRISTVGTEYEILSSLDFTQRRPRAILFANHDLRADYKRCYLLLHRQGYRVRKDDRESFALERSVCLQ